MILGRISCEETAANELHVYGLYWELYYYVVLSEISMLKYNKKLVKYN